MGNTLEINTGEEDISYPYLVDYSRLADLFMYPGDDGFKKKVKCIYDYLLETQPEAAEALQPFIDFTESSSLTEIQELFLRSFDLQAITTLDIGFILFGEDYKRGQLLVNLNTEHKNAGNPCHTELADHLPNILNLLPKMKDDSMRCEITIRLLMPAVLKMIDEFSTDRVEKKDVVYKKHQKILLESSQHYRLIYQNCLKALFIAMENDFGYDATVNEFLTQQSEQKDAAGIQGNTALCSGPIPQADYTRSIDTEMKIEKD
ncbi:MAG: hypothetical protein IPL97_04585 [Niastella sp.]|nr:hypothetical protein [Niastella sp.]